MDEDQACGRAFEVTDDGAGRRVRICGKGEIPKGQMVPIEIAGLPPLAAFNVDGRVYVTSNVCTHNVAILTDGFLDGEIVECPLHGGCFNVKTGEATQFPCERPLKVYSVIVEGDDIFIAA